MAVDWSAETVDRVRQLILGADPDIVEEAKWRKASNPDGVPTFSCDGLICRVETYKDKVKLTFAKGASLEDPASLFNASLVAGTRRGLEIFADDELVDAAGGGLIREAVAWTRACSAGSPFRQSAGLEDRPAKGGGGGTTQG